MASLEPSSSAGKRGEGNELEIQKPSIDEGGNLQEEILQQETQCGLGFMKFPWMQKLASKKVYVIIYGLAGLAEFAMSSYFVATMSTMEKRFQIPSTFTGVINSAWDVGSIITNLPATYLGRDAHKTRWVAWGTALVGLSCFMRLIPHWMYGPGNDALLLTKEFGNDFKSLNASDTSGPKLTLCGNNYTEYENCINASSGNISAFIFLVAHLLLGIGSAVYYTHGMAYLDDNARKNKAPILLAICMCLRMIGPTVGFAMASYALEIYVDPLLTPVITSSDPRWIGAWWLGWSPIGTFYLILALALAMFPRSLPRTLQRSVAAAAAVGRSFNPQAKAKKSFADFKVTVSRMLSNKVLVCNTISTICLTFGLTGQWIFMPKYIETQFHQSASAASLISGSVGLLCTGAGIMVSALVISKFKPNARAVAGWNVFVETLDCLGFLMLAFIGCEMVKLQGTPKPDGTLDLRVDCNANCFCPDSLRYSPVCHPLSGTTFFSPCHAGCSEATWGEGNSTSKVYSDCSCAPDNGPVIDGGCPVECTYPFILFIVVQCVQRFLGATGRAGNFIIHFRCVSPEDKPFSIGLSEFFVCGCAFIPGPIVFGYLIDLACIVWGQSCGSTGNCWLYDVDKLRLIVNLPIVGCLIFGTLWDIAVWYYVKDLQLYDEEEGEMNEPNEAEGNPAVAEDKRFPRKAIGLMALS